MSRNTKSTFLRHFNAFHCLPCRPYFLLYRMPREICVNGHLIMHIDGPHFMLSRALFDITHIHFINIAWHSAFPLWRRHARKQRYIIGTLSSCHYFSRLISRGQSTRATHHAPLQCASPAGRLDASILFFECIDASVNVIREESISLLPLSFRPLIVLATCLPPSTPTASWIF